MPDQPVEIKKILLPTDGSDYSRTAADYAIYAARLLKAQITALHVMDIKIIQGPLFSDVAFYSGLPVYYEFLPKIEDALSKRADTILDEIRKKSEQAGVAIELNKTSGIIEDTIIRQGDNFDLTVLAKRGEHFHFNAGGLLGSTAESVVRRSKRPVLITPVDFREIESIGLAFDGSIPATNALKLAAWLSEQAHWPITTLIISDDSALGAELTRKVETFLDDKQVDNEVLLLRGREDKEIMRFIGEGAVEMMIMGAYGKGRLKEFFLGSTTSNVIRNSNIPVLLMH
ncbi:MAG: universal stress protein [Syntrophaceae bacterium]